MEALLLFCISAGRILLQTPKEVSMPLGSSKTFFQTFNVGLVKAVCRPTANEAREKNPQVAKGLISPLKLKENPCVFTKGVILDDEKSYISLRFHPHRTASQTLSRIPEPPTPLNRSENTQHIVLHLIQPCYVEKLTYTIPRSILLFLCCPPSHQKKWKVRSANIAAQD